MKTFTKDRILSISDVITNSSDELYIFKGEEVKRKLEDIGIKVTKTDPRDVYYEIVYTLNPLIYALKKGEEIDDLDLKGMTEELKELLPLNYNGTRYFNKLERKHTMPREDLPKDLYFPIVDVSTLDTIMWEEQPEEIKNIIENKYEEMYCITCYHPLDEELETIERATEGNYYRIYKG